MVVNHAVVKEVLGGDYARYKEYLLRAIQSDNQYLRQINEYVVETSGKEMRPMLSLLAGRICGTLTKKNYACAAASEMLHTATLMHDDVADEASLRRGKLTVGAMFTPAAAVLAGDFWLSRAMHILATDCGTKIAICFSNAVQLMAEGELLQMKKADTLDTDENDYYKIITGKTAALFVAATKSAAIAARGANEAVAAIETYADNVGLAFQIRDDIFDYSPDLNTGKLPGVDIKERKITLPLLGAFKNNPDNEAEIRKAIADPVNVLSISGFVRASGGLEYAQNRLESHIKTALDALKLFPQTPEKECLMAFADYAGHRNK